MNESTPVSEATLSTASRLRTNLTRLVRMLRQHHGSGLTPSQLSALATIVDLGPLRMSALAQNESIDPSVATRIVASLEDVGLAQRDEDVDDRRALMVSATNAGRVQLEAETSSRTLFLAQRMSQLSSEDRDAIDVALGALERLVR